MTINKDERETLHLILDSLINERNRLDKIDPSVLERKFYAWHWSIPRREFFRRGSLFLRRLAGSKLHHAEMRILLDADLEEDAKDASTLGNVANAIRSYQPLFMELGEDEGDTNEKIEQIINDFMGIYWGDEPRFFAIMPKRQGQHKRPFRIAQLRRSALDWDKYLAAVGVKSRERHRIISDAYNTDWDTIRKWAQSILDQYDMVSWPPRDIDKEIQHFRDNPEEIMTQIARDGAVYWSEKLTATQEK